MDTKYLGQDVVQRLAYSIENINEELGRIAYEMKFMRWILKLMLSIMIGILLELAFA